MTLNEIAAQWWAERFMIDEQREAFRLALLRKLPDGDWFTYNDYDPNDLLLAATQEVVECSGNFFSGDKIFPRKTGLRRIGKELLGKEGYGGPWARVAKEDA